MQDKEASASLFWGCKHCINASFVSDIASGCKIIHKNTGKAINLLKNPWQYDAIGGLYYPFRS
jgi:hypothetical protein